MNDFFNKIRGQAKSLSEFLMQPRLQRKARITYQVIWNYMLLTFILLVIGAAFAGGVGAGYFAAMVKDEPIRGYQELKNSLTNYEETSEVFFAGNVYLGKLRTDLDREPIKLDQVSGYVKDAIIATEDEYFYEHKGVVPKAIVRAVLQEVTNASTQTGGSTLTQQLIKQQVLTNQVSFDRKAKEILLALRLEKLFDKDEILEAYLNVSPFGRNSSGRNIAGVQAAAKGIFGVSAKDLTLPQSAYITGLPQSPFGYTPYTNQGEKKKDLTPGITRMKTVLYRMREHGYISKEEYDKAITYDITKDFIAKQPTSSENYPYLTYEIEKRAKEIITPILAKQDGYEEADLEQNEELRNQYESIADQALRQNGFKIYTTINKKMFDNMTEVAENYPNYQPDHFVQKKDPDTGEMVTVKEKMQVGAILIENKTGKILSFVGGRGFTYDEQLNYATSAVRSNGSTMKPLLVYAPAMEYGVSYPGKTLANAPITIQTNGKPYQPENYEGGSITGLTTAREALKKSYNIPAILQYMQIKERRPAEFLGKMGFSTLAPEDYSNISTSIGGLKYGVTVEENVNAYSTFANGGKFVDAYMIDKIVDSSGKVIYQHKTEEVDVFTPQTAYLTIDMMRDVIRSGTATYANSQLKFSSDWAGKTGTSQNYHDAWFVATNPNVTFGTWMGYDTQFSVKANENRMTYSQRNINLWSRLINSAYNVNPEQIGTKKRHQMPSGIVQRGYCQVSGDLPSGACSKAGLVKSDLFNVKFLPSKSDDNLLSGKYVLINGKKYTALPTTPSEFTETGVIIKSKFYEEIGGKYVNDISKLTPSGSAWAKLLVTQDEMNDNGKNPAAPSITLKNNVLTWKKHAEKDIIGYRVYFSSGGAYKQVSTIKEDQPLSFKTSGGGIYYITAVDIAGKTSAPSNIVKPGAKEPAKEPAKTPSQEDVTISNPTPPHTEDAESTN